MMTSNVTEGSSQMIDAAHPAFKRFMEHAQALVDKDRNEGLPAGIPAEVLSAQVGRKYIRIVCGSGREMSGSAWAFIDRTTGDILKPESWARPAKHARGNILREDFRHMTGYGPAYLRG